MTGLAPATVIKWKILELKHKCPAKNVLPEDGLCRYLYQPGEQHRDQKKRATDLNWSKDTFRLERIMQEPWSGTCIRSKRTDADTGGYTTTTWCVHSEKTNEALIGP